MTDPVVFSRTVKPVCLPKDPSQSYQDKKIADGALPDKLMGVDVKVLSIEKCQESYSRVNEYVAILYFYIFILKFSG